MAQYDVPDMGLAFDDTEVPRVDITIDPADLTKILTWDLESNVEYPARFIYTTSYSIDTVENVGFRLRGNSSRQSGKKSFKVSFNSFVHGQKWQKLEKLNLNGEHNDPSIMRAKLAWDMYRMMGIPASRSNHVSLYVNEEYKGLYLNVEHIDEQFIKRRMRHEDGNLYKCLWPADMKYKGQDPDLYKEEFWGKQAYQLKTNTTQDNYSDLAHLIDVINNYNGADLLCELELILDVDAILRCMAMDVLIGNWDGAFVNKNNFYLYTDPVTSRMTFIPYDLDNTFGIDWFDVDWAAAQIYSWFALSGESRPFYQSLMKIPEYKSRYTRFLEKAMDEFFNESYVNNYLDNKLQLLREFRVDDTYAALDYGYDLSDFESSIDEGAGAHVPYGIKEYVKKRYTSAQSALIPPTIIPLVKELSYRKTDKEIQFYVAVDSEVSSVQLHTKIDDEVEETWTVNLEAGLGTHSINISSAQQSVNYYMTIDYGGATPRHFPFCKNAQIRLTSDEIHDLVINEFVAANATGQSDEAGEFEDWIELYNAGGQRLDLSNYYLSDDRDDPSKWRLPQHYLYPAQYAIYWMDSDGEEGPNHGNFKLSKNGEFLGLYAGPYDGYFPVDTLTFSTQEEDRSFARTPNGEGPFVITDKITFGSNNDLPSSTLSGAFESASIFPNPVGSWLLIDGTENVKAEIYNVAGEKMGQWNGTDRKDVSLLSSGTYYLKLVEKTRTRWLTFIKI